MSVFRRTLVLLSLAILALAPIAQAQVTTGNLAGVVTADGSALPGVTIEAVHTPTGTRYSDVTGGDGRFTIPNVRVGGPYTITANLEGFKTATASNVSVNLGSTAEVPLTLSLATVSETITVTAEVDPIINPNRTGSTSAVAEQQIESLPTVNRSLQDFARTNPYFRVDPTDLSATRVNVAGRNNRYNSIQIDGAVNNDLFGLADTGTPGGQTDAQPISLDAIQELQMVVSPYDVRQGGFTGGGINAITRSGTNDWSGSIFASQRNEDLIGEGPRADKYTKFDQDQYGGRFGGPILRDRLFFFVSGEMNRKSSPSGVAASAADYPSALKAGLVKVSDILKARYNYDPGTLDDINAATDSDTLFGRLDMNAGNNQITLRHNYVKAGRDVLGTRTNSRFTFPTTNYNQADETNSTVAQINSVFTANAYNEARIGFQTIRDARTVPVQISSIEIGGAAQNATIAAGTERFSGANKLDQDILELTDDFTWVRGSHTLVFGTHNEFFDFNNLFQSDAYGAYFFGSATPLPQGVTALDSALAAFDANKPTEYRITYATGSDPFRPTSFEAAQLGFYINDTFRVNNQLNLVFGVRADMPRYGDTPSANPIVAAALPGFRTDVTPTEDPVISPRFGFNWNPGVGGNQQVRGGIGIFAGRTPFVWVSNAYAGTGVEQISLTCLASAGCAVPAYNPDINAQPRNVGTPGAPGTLTVDVIDPEFEFPRLLRATLGYDRDLFWGIRGSAEAVYSKTQQDVFYLNLNRRQSGVNPVDGRPTFTKVDTAQLSDAYYLTNTQAGRDLTATLQLVRPYTNGLSIGAGYAWQDAKSAFDATSSRAVSNWRFRHTKGNIFDDDLSDSAFEVEQRLNANLSYDFRTGPLSHNVGLYYNMQSGRPFSMLLTNDANLDLNNSNDLLWVPASSNAAVVYQFSNGSTSREVTRPDGTKFTETAIEVFRTFMDRFGVNQSRGGITDRYQFQEPWNRQLDFHYELGFNFMGVETGVTFDVLNALNLIDNDYGTVRSIPNQNTQIAGVTTSVNSAGQTVITYREAANGRWNADSLFTTGTNDIRSRWQGRLGLRVSF
jgi:outer membrane receptor for ferrienterochelin and colicin